jgi:hypothetical protein
MEPELSRSEGKTEKKEKKKKIKNEKKSSGI